MSYLIDAVLNGEERNDLREFIDKLKKCENRYLLKNDILNVFNEFCSEQEHPEKIANNSLLGQLIYYTQEIILEKESLCLIIRPKIATQEAYRLFDDLGIEALTIEELLDVRDRYVNQYHPEEGDVFEIDLQSFYDYSPTIRDPKNIGKGLQFLNRFLSSKLFQDPKQWLEALYNFLRLHKYL